MTFTCTSLEVTKFVPRVTTSLSRKKTSCELNTLARVGFKLNYQTNLSVDIKGSVMFDCIF